MTMQEFEDLPEEMKDMVFCAWAKEEFVEIEKANKFLDHVRETSCPDCIAEMTKKFLVFIERNVDLVDLPKHMMN